MTKEECAKSYIKTYYDEYMIWVDLNYNVDDIDDNVFEKAIKDAIYEGFLRHLITDSFEFMVLGDENCDTDDWRVDDNDILEYDIKYMIKESLGLD